MFPQISPRNKVIAGIIAALLLVGVGLGYWSFSHAPPVQQVYHPEERLSGGAVLAEVKPDANAKTEIPLRKGETLTRKISATVKVKLPTVEISGGLTMESKVEQLAQMVKASAPPEAVEQAKQEIVAACVDRECPPVTVNVDLVREEDGQQRAIVTSNGEILKTVDIPRENAAAPPKSKLWAAGAVFNPVRETAGVTVERDIGFMRVGVDLMQRDAGRFPTEPTIRALIRW